MEAMAAKLKELAGRLDVPNSFEKGQIVAWKPGLKNRMFPEDGEPAIVTSVLPTPVFDLTETSAASPYFQEALCSSSASFEMMIFSNLGWTDEGSCPSPIE